MYIDAHTSSYNNHAGRLNIGDQVLVCDGVSLIDVTHDEAGLAFKQAMDSQSVNGKKKNFKNVCHYFLIFFYLQSSIELVVAVSPET